MFNKPKPAVHLMFDLETGGVKPGATIFSIGACLFTPAKLQNYDAIKQHSYYANIAPESGLELGLQDNPDTMAWWAKQRQEAKDALLTDPLPIQEAIGGFLTWLSALEAKEYWANSPSFDKVILDHAIELLGLEWPFPFWHENCVRTIKKLAYPNRNWPKPKPGMHHNALEDSIFQARSVQTCYKRLGLLV